MVTFTWVSPYRSDSRFPVTVLVVAVVEGEVVVDVEELLVVPLVDAVEGAAAVSLLLVVLLLLSVEPLSRAEMGSGLNRRTPAVPTTVAAMTIGARRMCLVLSERE
jgi:hypothetical protein